MRKLILVLSLILFPIDAFALCMGDQEPPTVNGIVRSIGPVLTDSQKRSYCHVALETDSKTIFKGVSKDATPDTLCNLKVAQKIFFREVIPCCDTIPTGSFGCYIPKFEGAVWPDTVRLPVFEKAQNSKNLEK